MITGHGETKSTPDIVVSMMDLDPTMTNPKPASYLAIADGEKQLNMAKVVSFFIDNIHILADMFIHFIFQISMPVIIKVCLVLLSLNVVQKKKLIFLKLVIVVNVIPR